MIRYVFFHPLGFACSAIWFLFCCWLAYKAFRFFFPATVPPQD